MNLNDPLSIRRVANGFIVTVEFNQFVKQFASADAELLKDAYVFPTLDTLIAWLLEHYPHPEPGAAAPSPLYYIQRNLTNTYYVSGYDGTLIWTDNKSKACAYNNEVVVNEMVKLLRKDGYGIYIVDEFGHVPFDVPTVSPLHQK